MKNCSSIYGVFVAVVICVSCIQATTFIDFEAPAYTVDAAIDGQDGWVATGGMIKANSDTGGGTWVLDFTNSLGISVTATRDLDLNYNSGEVSLTSKIKWTYDKIGAFSLLDSTGTAFLNFGLSKTYLQPGLYWYVDGGAAGSITDANMPDTSSGLRFIEISIDLDLDTSLADISWGEVGGPKIPLFTDYAISAADFNSLSFANSKSAAMIDDVNVSESSEPETSVPTFIDFETPAYTVDTAVDGQDGWSATGGVVRADPCSGTWVLDFSDSYGVRVTASRYLDEGFASGKVSMSAKVKWTWDKIGIFSLYDAAGTKFLSFGGSKDYLAPGVYWFVDGGSAGSIVDTNMPVEGESTRLVEVFIEIDLDTNLADISWSEVGGAKTLLFSDYAISPAGGFYSFDFANSKAASMVDDISVKIPVIVPTTCQEVWDSGNGLPGDINMDCYIDMIDLAMLAGNWIQCNNPTDPNCGSM